MKILKSACRMCHGGCGVLVYVEKGRVVDIKGDPESPLNRGEHLYNPLRLKYPLKRVGKRGEGKWQRVSWDEALEEIVTKITGIRDRYGVESIVVGQGTGRHHFHHVARFANALGTPNWMEPGTAQCFVPRLLTGIMTYGSLPVCDYYGDVNPACLLVWGHNPLVSGPDGEICFRVRDCMKKGTSMLVVDPRQTEMAAAAEMWLQVRPGSDDALALSMLHVIINESLYDKDFVEKWTIGFDELKERVRQYTPQWAEKVTWVPANKIKEAARMFALTKPAALEWGAALEQTPNCLQTVRAVALLPAITGNIDIPGGWILGMQIMPEASAFSRRLPRDMQKKRLGADQFKVLSGEDALWPSAHIPTVLKAMRTGEPYPVTALLNFGNNGLVSYANSKDVYQSFMSLDFMLAVDIYMTPTAGLADIVLPAATWLELDGLLAAPGGAPHVVLAQQEVVRLGECRSDEEILAELARRLHLDSAQENVVETLNQQLAVTGERFKEFAGINFEEMKQRGAISVPLQYKKFEETGFQTVSGKVELASGYLKRLGYDPLPFYEEPPESPISQPELAKDYPLILITGARSPWYFHSEYRQIPSLRRKEPEPQVEIHPETARKQGINQGDWVWIETPRGRIKQKALFTRGIDPRVVNVRHGWWFPGKQSPGDQYGVWESNANVLTNNAPPYDPAMGTYQLRALLCKIYPVIHENIETLSQGLDSPPKGDMGDEDVDIDFDI
jgi:anaerobic selenocysteine-containing dehydrogenase